MNHFDDAGLYRGSVCHVQPYDDGPQRRSGFAVFWIGRQILGVFTSKDVANGIAVTFEALTPEGGPDDEPPIDALMELIGFRQILADVVEREAKRLAAQELATRAAANRLRGRRWP